MQVALWRLTASLPASLLATLIVAQPASADPPAARFIHPTDAAVDVDVSRPFEWTSVPAAESYYLWVGSTPGANDLVNTGEIQQTTYLAASLPEARTLHAVIWTKISGRWWGQAITFSTRALTARWIYPTAPEPPVDPARPFEWTRVPAAQAYYLWIGTAPDTNDLVNTGEIQQTAYWAPNLPEGRTLYASIWTRTGGIWRSARTTFTTPTLAARWIYPQDEGVNVDVTRRFEWTSVPNAQAYYLWVGTAPGTNDLVNTGEIQQTAYWAPHLPAGRRLHATIWTRVAGAWRSAAIAFTTRALSARWIHPTDGAADVDPARPLEWTSVGGAQAYYLWVGTSRGAKDLVNTGEIQQTAFLDLTLPPGRVLYAVIWTKVDGTWRGAEARFTTKLGLAARFVYPWEGAIRVDPARPFEWTGAARPDGYRLQIGTSPGGGNLLDTGEIHQTSFGVPPLPPEGTLYARVWTRSDNVWRFAEVAFTLAPRVEPSRMLFPPDNATEVDGSQPLQWVDVDLARGYEIELGTAPGRSDVHDSGRLRVTRRFVPDLPAGVPVFGRLYTLIDGEWLSTDFTFSVGSGRAPLKATPEPPPRIESGLWAADFVRRMADEDHRPHNWTELWDGIPNETTAGAADYSRALLSVLGQINIGSRARRLDVSFNGALDTHTLVELEGANAAAWMLLDPTFNLSMKRWSDDGWASAEDVASATRSQAWKSISYVSLGSRGQHAVHDYYLDYPVLFLNVFHEGDPILPGRGHSPLPYLQEMPLPFAGSRQIYFVRCEDGTEADVLIDGRLVSVPCAGVDSLSPAFAAQSVAAPPQSPDSKSGATSGAASFRLFRALRFVF